jgi:hypothetical protein
VSENDGGGIAKRTLESFPPEVAAKLKTYVYRLIDPRNGETFYVGKGVGDRVFAHVHENVTGDELGDGKLKRIRQIRLAGLEVGHVIHRHGMDDQTAVAVEAALIDAYPGTTNCVGGQGSGEYGSMHAIEIIRQYSAKAATFEHNALLISINRSAEDNSIYEATRYSWKIDPNKAQHAEVILATRHGIIVEAFVATRWLPATAANFSGREAVANRWGFEGDVAPDKVRRIYVGKRVPDEYRRPGAANPIKYTYDE